MNFPAKTYTIIAGLAVFLGLPLLFYALGDAPRRSIVKEVISLLTLLAFTAMIGQYFLARSNEVLLSLFKPPQIQKFHKVIAYGAIVVIFLHPVLIVLPRYFEGGVNPWDAFVIMITEFDNLGIVLGLVAWVMLFVLFLTAFWRRKLIPRFAHRYRGWRYFHSALAVIFTVLALWHAIMLGRHTDLAYSIFLVTLVVIGLALLARMYWWPKSKTPAAPKVSQGASS